MRNRSVKITGRGVPRLFALPITGKATDFMTDNGSGAHPTVAGGLVMSESEMQAELERLRAENSQLKNKDKGGLTLKVSAKGGFSLYGMGWFSVALCKEQR